MKTFYFYYKNGKLTYSENRPKGKKYWSVEAENDNMAWFYYQIACGF